MNTRNRYNVTVAFPLAFWSNTEEEIIKNLYFANLANVGNGLRYQTKTKLYNYIAQELANRGSKKTVENIQNKFKNMRKHGELMKKKRFARCEVDDNDEPALSENKKGKLKST
jgi:hypothetical protein